MIQMIRCDDRLIHGQCMTKIVQYYFIKEIIVIDDFTAGNAIMRVVFEKAVPPSMKASVYSLKQSIPFVEAAITSPNNTLILFRTPPIYGELLQRIPTLPKILNIGPVPKRDHAKEAVLGTYLLPEEANSIASYHEQGVDVFFQVIPDQKKYPWTDIQKKFK